MSGSTNRPEDPKETLVDSPTNTGGEGETDDKDAQPPEFQPKCPLVAGRATVRFKDLPEDLIPQSLGDHPLGDHYSQPRLPQSPQKRVQHLFQPLRRGKGRTKVPSEGAWSSSYDEFSVRRRPKQPLLALLWPLSQRSM